MPYRPYPNADRALRQMNRHGRTLTAVPLEELSNQDLTQLALSRFGGPTSDQVAEISRRLARSARTLGESIDRMRLRQALTAA